jgi:REP element-mobilizing transposase RayT
MMKHNRQSIRLQSHDYASPGYYFITICTFQREQNLGAIYSRRMHINAAGLAIYQQWFALAQRFAHINLDEFIIMPDHVHAIIQLQRPDIYKVGAASSAPTIGDIVRCYKSETARIANWLLHRSNRPFWQRGYWDRIIRDDAELKQVRQYIRDNPKNWGRP